jgi:ABC-type dipeptide/oligopeptide/nickel transport system permease component
MHTGYLARRLLQFLIVLWGTATLNFIVPRLEPGNPIRERLMGAMQQTGPMQQGIEEMVRSYNVQFGLDQPRSRSGSVTSSRARSSSRSSSAIRGSGRCCSRRSTAPTTS